MAHDIDKPDALLFMRKLEIEAYCSVINALRAHGDLSERGKLLLDEIRDLFCITDERHKAEIRRAANDEKLASVANSVMGATTRESWLAEGRRVFPPVPRIDPQSAFTRLANAASKKQVKMEMAKFFEAKDLLERAIKKQEESKVSMIETDRMDTKRRLAELTPSSDFPSTSVEEPKTKQLQSASHRKRVRVCSPQPSLGVEAELAALTETAVSSTVKVKKVKEPGSKKQRIRMSPSGNNSAQENLPADEASVSLPPSSLALSSPVKGPADGLDPISPLATPGQLVRNVDLFANPTDVVNDVVVEKFHKSPPKSPKQPKEKKTKQTKKSKQNSSLGATSHLKSDSVSENTASAASPFSSSPPVTFSGISAHRTSHHSSLMQQQAAAVTAAAAAQSLNNSALHHHPTMHTQPSNNSQAHPQGPSAVVITAANHMNVSSPSQSTIVHASPGKVVQSSYHNYAPPLAPLSINPMRLVGRAGPGAAISTSAATASPPSVTANTIRQQDHPTNFPLIKLTPQVSSSIPGQRPPLIVASGSTRPTAILTPAASGFPGVLTLRATTRPTLTPVTSTSSNVRPSIVIHQTRQPQVVMSRVGQQPAASSPVMSTASTNVPTIHTSVSTSSSGNSRPVIISSSSGSNANVLFINKHQIQQMQRPVLLATSQHLQSQPSSQPVTHIAQSTTVISQPHTQLPSSASSVSTDVRSSNSSSDYSFTNFQASSKHVPGRFTNELELASPPAVGAESVVETSHEMLSNGNAPINHMENAMEIVTSGNHNCGGNLDLLHQAVEVIGAASNGVAHDDLVNFIGERELTEHSLGNYENAVGEGGNYHSTAMSASSANHDSELFNEDLMMAIMNSNAPSNGPHRQTQPS